MANVLTTLLPEEIAFIDKWLKIFSEDEETFLGQLDSYDNFENRLRLIMINEGLLAPRGDPRLSKVDATSLGVYILRIGGMSNYISELKDREELERKKTIAEYNLATLSVKNYGLFKLIAIFSMIISIAAIIVAIVNGG